MIVIAHRGNIAGKSPGRENAPDYIEAALKWGFDVEVDVWAIPERTLGDRPSLFLGHDKPEYLTQMDFLLRDKIWCHAKNIEALDLLLKAKAHCFFHDKDDATLTSRGYIWTYPGKELKPMSVCVLPEQVDQEVPPFIHGVCTDLAEKYL